MKKCDLRDNDVNENTERKGCGRGREITEIMD